MGIGSLSPYAQPQSGAPSWKTGEREAACVFLSLTLFIILDVNVGIYRVFRKKQGLYYWSLIFATWGTAVVVSQNQYLMNVLSLKKYCFRTRKIVSCKAAPPRIPWMGRLYAAASHADWTITADHRKYLQKPQARMVCNMAIMDGHDQRRMERLRARRMPGPLLTPPSRKPKRAAPSRTTDDDNHRFLPSNRTKLGLCFPSLQP